MVGTVKAKAPRLPRKGEKVLCLPSPGRTEDWQLWAFAPSGTAEFLQSASSPAGLQPPPQSQFVLPTAEVYSIPLWINETEPRQFRDVVALQLELQGFRPAVEAGQVMDWDVVATENGRTLLLVGLLAETLPQYLLEGMASRFDVSMRYRTYPPDALTLWREQDRLVLVITRGEKPVFFQTLKTEILSASVVQDIVCTISTLEMQGFIAPLRQAVAWLPLTSSEKTALADGIRLPVQEFSLPAPRLPERSWNLIPAEIEETHRRRHSRRFWKRGLLMLLAVYLLIVAAMAARYLILSREVGEVRAWQEAHAASLDVVQQTTAAWRDLAPALDQNSYPLEQLLQCTRSLPADQLHLTLFEARPGHLLIKGEATNAAAAFQFLDRLKKNDHFAGYTWDMAPPHLLPNDLAQLQIEGTRASSD